jgi:hypothetical protein
MWKGKRDQERRRERRFEPRARARSVQILRQFRPSPTVVVVEHADFVVFHVFKH